MSHLLHLLFWLFPLFGLAAATLPKQFLTRIEVQKLLKLRTPRTLDKWERLHKGPPRLNIGGKLVLYDYDKLLAWLENQQTTPRAPRKRGRPRKAGTPAENASVRDSGPG